MGPVGGVAVAGIAVVVWGSRVATSIPAWSYPPELRGDVCSGEHDADVFADIERLWGIWLLLVLLSAAGAITWGRAGCGDWRVRILAIIGGLTTAALFPLRLMVGYAMDCGL